MTIKIRKYCISVAFRSHQKCHSLVIEAPRDQELVLVLHGALCTEVCESWKLPAPTLPARGRAAAAQMGPGLQAGSAHPL